jgi:hypothetical protein
MTALTKDRNTPRRIGEDFTFPVAAAVTCHAGAIAVLDASGNVKPAVAATGLICAGRFEDSADNAAGSAGDISARVAPGVFQYANSAAADAITAAEIGDTCYLVDDQTVAKTDAAGTRSAAGKIVGVDSAGVWVRMGL